MKNLVNHFFRETDAATAVEYAVMLAMILLVAISAVATVGQQSGGLWGGVDSDLNAVGFGG